MPTPDEIVAGIAHMRDSLECQRVSIQGLQAQVKARDETISRYVATNDRLNQELAAAEVELRRRRAGFPA